MPSDSRNVTGPRPASMPEPPTPRSNGSPLVTRNADGSFYCQIPAFLELSPSPSDDVNDEYEDHGRLSGNGTADDAFHGTSRFASKEELSDLESTDSASVNRSLSTTTTHLSGATATEDTDTGFVSSNAFNPSKSSPQLLDFSIPDDRITTVHNSAGSVSARLFFYPQMDPFPVHRISLLAHLKCHLRAAISNPQSRTPLSAVLAEVQYHIALMEPDHGMRLPAQFDRPAIYMHSECMACMVWHPKEVSKMLNLCTFIRGAVVEEVMLVEGVLEEVLATVGDLGWLHAWGGGNGAGGLQDVAGGAEVSDRRGTMGLKRVKSAREAAAEVAEKLEKQGVLKPTPLVEELHEVGGRSQANGTRKLTKEKKSKETREEVEGSEDRCKVCSLKKLFK